MRRALLALNALGTAVTLLSALAVLGSLLFVPGYRIDHHDSLPFVLGYAALQAWFLWAFLRDTPAVPWIALAKAVAGLLLVATFKVIGPDWIQVTPGRYVYQLFDWSDRLDWGPDARLGLYAFVFLGRGAFNTFSAFELTRPLWWSLRDTRPVLGRVMTAIPLAAMVTCVWLFFEWRRLDQSTFSPEASEVARLVLDGIDCPTLRQHEGGTTEDVRQRGDRRYHVQVHWRCTDVIVAVQAEDGRIGVARAPRLECCETAPARPS